MPSSLSALSPLDGRYETSADPLRPYFSEAALIRHRVRVELEWLKALAAERRIRELKPFSRATLAALDRLVAGFTAGDAAHIKNIEAEINHDVKAIEYWLKGKLARNAQVQRSLEFVHFACTSEDINNLSYALMLAHSRERVMPPRLTTLAPGLTGRLGIWTFSGKCSSKTNPNFLPALSFATSRAISSRSCSSGTFLIRSSIFAILIHSRTFVRCSTKDIRISAN